MIPKFSKNPINFRNGQQLISRHKHLKNIAIKYIYDFDDQGIYNSNI